MNTPVAVKEVTKVVDIESHLNSILLLSYSEVEILSNLEVEAVYPRSSNCTSLRILTSV